MFHLVGIGSIVANTVALALNVPYVVLCQDNWNWLKITAIIIQAIVTLIMAYQQFKDFGSLRTDHVTSEANYAALYDMIKNELRKDSKHRQDAEHFIEWINKQMSDLKASSPLIPPKILDAYRKMIFGKNIADPEGIDEIFIFENDDNREVRETKFPFPPNDCFLGTRVDRGYRCDGRANQRTDFYDISSHKIKI